MSEARRAPDDDRPGLASKLKLVLGGRTAARLDRLGLETVSDLLRHYPRKYSEQGRLTDLSHLRVGERATVWARIDRISARTLDRRRGQRRPRTITTLRVTDGHRSIDCTFFNQPWMARQLHEGMEALFSGKVSAFRGAMQMTSPNIASTDAGLGDVEGTLDMLETFANGVIPVYPLTEGVTASSVQSSIKHVLDLLDRIPDPVPETVLARHGLTDLDTALRNIHRPSSPDALAAAQRRLTYDEALALQLVLARRRARARAHPAEPCPRISGGLLDVFDEQLVFELTDGQREVGEVIAADLASLHPMNRLLHGEVGSGKTVVALRAMLQVIDSGRQAVLLAPTEVLASQHARSLRATLGPLGHGGELGAPPGATTVTLLTGSTSAAARREATLTIASGQPGIVVGTHALLSDDVIFTNLGLVVVDEQHRFGVEQRNALSGNAQGHNPPHVLVMTATPIPRTVAMTVYGDLDTSTLTELPHGRAGVSTTVVPAADKPGWLERAWQRIHEEVAAGHQAYVVCPRIGDGSAEDTGDAAGDAAGSGGRPGDDGGTERRPPLAVLDMIGELRDGPLAGLRIEMLHGRLPPADKDRVMRAFSAGEIDVLVATTVIEVGVDVPRASVMVILDADRFGMSQLHQLRGRVGRGTAAGVCLLVTEIPAGTAARERLDAVAASNDGFALAEADLELRREGDVLGTTQAGRASSLKLLRLRDDRDLIDAARTDARELVGDDPAMAAHPALAAMADAIVDVEAQDYLHKG